MNRENSMSGELRALRVGSILLYSNEFKNYGSLLLHSNRAAYKEEIIISAIKRIKFLEQLLQYLQSLDYSKLFDSETLGSNFNLREMKKLYFFVADVYDAPSKRKTCYLRLKKHINNFDPQPLFKNGTLTRYICDDFDTYCDEKQMKTFKEKEGLIDEYSTLKTGTPYGYKTKLSVAIQQKFLLDHRENQKKQKELHKLLLSKKKSLDIVFAEDNIKRLQQLILSDALLDIYSIYSQAKITVDDREKLAYLFQSSEVEEFIKYLKIINEQYTSSIKSSKRIANGVAINVIKNKNLKEYYEDMANELLLLLTEYMWNGKYDYPDPKIFYVSVGNNMNGTIHKDFNNTTLSIFDEDGELLSYVDKEDNVDSEFKIPDNLGGFHDTYAEILKPYQIKYATERDTRRNINVALLFLEFLGDYEIITQKVYGGFNERTYANARQAKSTGKDIIISEVKVTKHDIKTIDLFSAVEIYSRKKANDTI